MKQRNRRVRQLATVLIGLATAPLLAVGPAHAQTLDWTDPSGDMWHAQDEDNDTWTPSPEHTRGDALRTRVRNSTYALTIRHWVTDLGDDQVFYTSDRIRTDEGRAFEIRLQHVDEDVAGAAVLVDGEPVRCANLTASADPAAAATYVRVPRNCLSRPRWVRVASVTEYYGSSERWFDDAHGTGVAPIDPLFARFSSRVWRGGN